MPVSCPLSDQGDTQCSFWNAYAVGSTWVEAKHAGGMRRFIAWMGAIMTDIGFTWCFLVAFGLGLNHLGYLNDYSTQLLFDAGYVIIVPVLLFAGWAITFDQWARMYRAEQRSLASVGVAGYNTFAMSYNTYNAVRSMPDAVGRLLKALTGGRNRRNGQGVLILLVLIVAFGLGTIVTYLLINRFAARDEPMPTPMRIPAADSR